MTDTTTEDLISTAKTATLTTTTTDGNHVSRPMGLQEAEFDGDLWFFACDNSAKVRQISAAPEVNVSCSDTNNHSWTSIAGRAQIVHDRQKAEQPYKSTLQAWFPDGLDTPGLTLIKVEADTAECWEGQTSTVAWVVGILRAAVSKDTGRDPIRNDTVDL